MAEVRRLHPETATATTKAAVAEAATTTDRPSGQRQFARARHLLFACIGLLQAPLSGVVWPLLPLVVDTSPWTAELDVLARLIPMCFAAFVAWLAFERFNTGSGVTVIPRRWADTGLVVILAVVAREATTVWMLSHKTPAKIEQLEAAWTSYYTGPDGELLIGWVIAMAFAAATAEEIVHRALLLRALEGYMNRWLALVAHAVVFDAVHVFIYGYGFAGGIWFVMALIYGYAFQRTRALAVPVLLHASSLVIFYTTIWYLGR